MADVKFRMKGLCCATVTPFKDNGDINPEVLEDYVKHLLEFGAPNIFANGTNGEGSNMTLAERKEMAEAWVKAGRGKLSSIVLNIGAGSLRDSQELARHADEIGVDAISCVSATYHKPESMEDYVEYMRQVAGAAPNTPFLLYDNEIMTGLKFNVDEFFTIALETIPTLVGVKYTTLDFIGMHTVVRNHGHRIQVIHAIEDTFMEALSIGLDVTVMNSYSGKILNRLMAAAEKQDTQTAFKEQWRTIATAAIRNKHRMSIPGGSKAFLRVLGLPVGSPRLPLSPVTDAQVQALREELQDMGFFDWGVN